MAAPVAYRPPPDLAISGATVLLFKVAFQQTEIEQIYHTTVAMAASGDLTTAEKLFSDGLGRIPQESRFVFAESIGAAFYEYGADAAAVQALRLAFQSKADPAVATTMAWILATTSDAALRDGRAALALIDPVAQAELNDPTVLSALAAALAEVGRFPGRGRDRGASAGQRSGRERDRRPAAAAAPARRLSSQSRMAAVRARWQVEPDVLIGLV